MFHWPTLGNTSFSLPLSWYLSYNKKNSGQRFALCLNIENQQLCAVKPWMEIQLPLGVAEHELQQMQDARQFLFQTLEHMDLHGMHCDAQSDQEKAI
jgi:hypothetical protein